MLKSFNLAASAQYFILNANFRMWEILRVKIWGGQKRSESWETTNKGTKQWRTAQRPQTEHHGALVLMVAGAQFQAMFS